ncbi:hypothetical protein D917_09053 [Trichinella nativa]|uniref:Uncharacterized protein n=1 Tax=Trichinella nativa TaxID=6335 RepID=A0A1Y3EH75_9BILA|nr:hypothetical protein D917_09053 [Trichinella nativa]
MDGYKMIKYKHVICMEHCSRRENLKNEELVNFTQWLNYNGLSTYNCRVMCVVSQLVDFHGNCDINPNYHAIYNQFIRLGSRGETNWAREAFASAASFNASTNTHSLIFGIW